MNPSSHSLAGILYLSQYFSCAGERRRRISFPCCLPPAINVVRFRLSAQVDAVCSDSQADVRRWRRAQIVEESSTGRLRLSYDGLSDYHDDWVNRDSSNIAPPGYAFPCRVLPRVVFVFCVILVLGIEAKSSSIERDTDQQKELVHAISIFDDRSSCSASA